LVENTFSTPAISGNGSYAAHYSLTLPSNASGTCTAYVILDNDNTAGQTNYNNDMANGSFTVAGSATPTPSATTNTATNVTISGATLNATVNPNGSNTVVHFEYGTTTAYGTSTSPISIGSGNTPLNQSDTVSSLTPSTIYHYHVVADNAGGTAYGNDASFTTHTDQQTQPVLSVTPQDVALPSAAESTNLTVSNSGTGTLSYNASVTSGSSWLQITSGSVGGNSGTIIVAYSANTGAQRIGNVIVTANAAGGSPSVVTITQAAAPPAGTQPLGIDVYSPRYPIVWNQVSEAGKTFAFLKATEGVTFTDTEFLSSNIQDARQNNILVSAYHFALPLDEPGVAGAESEAQHFLDVATPYIGDGYLPPILDIEDDLASRHPEITTCLTPDHSHIDLVCLLTKPVLSAWVRAWVRKVELTAHTRPIVYMDGHYARDGMEIDLASYPLWIAAPGSPTGDPPLGLGPWSRWVFKQYSTTGGVPGVHGTDVDQDSFYSSVSALNELTRRSAGPDITSISAVSLTAGQPVAFQITATGSPTEYDIVDLPDGLTVNPLSGLITGVPAASGTFDATISATNSSGTATAPLHLNILPATSLVITSSTVVSTEGGQTLAYQIIATNSPTSYSATGLPAGLTIDSVTGLISGVPTTVGTFNVMITVSNAAGGSPTGSTNGTAMTTVVFYVAGEQPAFPAQLGNISTRLRVQTGDNAMIGGIIVTGPQSKTVVVRGIGPSLLVPGALADPVIEVHGSAGELLATNDNWRDDDPIRVQHVIDSGLAPSNDLEAAKWGILTPGAYTVVVRGNNNTTGIGLFEVYDLDRTEDSKLANISTRGFVDTGDNVMIGGTIIVGSVPTTVLFRAIGPSLVNFGISNALQDPMLELHDSNGALTASNDNWRDTQEAEIIATGIPPSNNFESAILVTLPANNSAYTAIVRGKDNTTGVAVVEAYQLQ
jgi:GH25 family lysozyme M1 (1,4-beta-N-acetylmuramidase)